MANGRPKQFGATKRTITLDMTQDLLDRIDAEVERQRGVNPGLGWSRQGFIRYLIETHLRAVSAGGGAIGHVDIDATG